MTLSKEKTQQHQKGRKKIYWRCGSLPSFFIFQLLYHVHLAEFISDCVCVRVFSHFYYDKKKQTKKNNKNRKTIKMFKNKSTEPPHYQKIIIKTGLLQLMVPLGVKQQNLTQVQ